MEVALLLAFGTAVCLLGMFAVALAPPESSVAAWWPAAGVGVAVLIRRWDRRWSYAAMIVLASGLGNLLAGRPPAISLGFGVSNAAEAIIVAWLTVRTGATVLRRIGDVGNFVVATAAGVAVVSIGGATTVTAFGSGDIVSLVLSAFPSHAASIVLIAPIALAPPFRQRRKWIEHIVLWVIAVASVVLVFAPGQKLPMTFVTTGFVLLSSARLGVRSTAIQLMVIGVIVTVLTGAGGGPFAIEGGQAQHSAASNSLVQLFIIANAALLLPFAVVVAERRIAHHHLRESELTFRAGFSEAILAMALVRIERGALMVIEANSAARAMVRAEPGTPFESRLRAQDGGELRNIALALATGGSWRGSMLLRGDSPRHFDVAVARMASANRQDVAAIQVVETTEQHQARAALEHSAQHDHLTSLPNRATFERRLDDLVDRTRRQGTVLGVMFIDVDDFKTVNDEFGHAAGDELLIQIARRLQALVRGDDVVGRVGGDEFVVALPSVGTGDSAMKLATRIQDAVRQSVMIDGITIQPSVSVGVALSTPTSTRRTLLSEADLALYASKAAGKGIATLYGEELSVAATAYKRIESELTNALAENQFEMFMQPIVDVSSGGLLAAESLVRWRHPTEGLLAPAGWLEIAESSGLMPELGAFVIHESIRHAATWADRFGADQCPTLHVNVSARQFEDHRLPDLVLGALEAHRFPPSKLLLELTETYLATVGPALIRELTGLRDAGIQIAADDFGTGYSPLTRIVELPISMIKIDRQFISALGKDRRAHAIVETLLNLAATLELDVVAEGVELESERQILEAFGCPMGQGYLWSRPVPAADFSDLIGAGMMRADLSKS